MRKGFSWGSSYSSHRDISALISAVKMLANFAGGSWLPFSSVLGKCPYKQALDGLGKGVSQPLLLELFQFMLLVSCALEQEPITSLSHITHMSVLTMGLASSSSTSALWSSECLIIYTTWNSRRLWDQTPKDLSVGCSQHFFRMWEALHKP